MGNYADRFGFRKCLLAVASCGIGAWAIPASAQQQQSSQTQLEEVTVTGSYIKRPADRPQALTVVNSADIELHNRPSLAQMFKDLPQAIGGRSTIADTEGGNSPTRTINLRGLGARATLVLLNGHRQTIDGGTTGGVSAVDIDNLAPSIMINRVEVLTDGASALYGSDAVAGVVNFITRDSFEGVEVQASAQEIEASRAHKPDMNVGMLFGSQGTSTQVVAGVEYASTQPLRNEDRYSVDRLTQYGFTSGFGNPGTFVNLNTGERLADPLCGSDKIGGPPAAGYLNPLGNQCRMLLSLGMDIQSASGRLNGLAVMTHKFNDKITAKVEAGFARTRYNIDFRYVVPYLPPLPFVPATNPGVIAANAADPNFAITDYQIFTRAYSPAFENPVHNTTKQDTYRTGITLTGSFGDSSWTWNANSTFSQNDSNFSFIDSFRDRYTDALQGYGGAHCDASPATDPTGALAGVGDCQWWNPFANRMLAQPGDPNYNDPSLGDWFIAHRVLTGFAQLSTLEFVATGNLWDMAGGTTGLAVGTQARSQKYTQTWDDVTHDGGFAFSTIPYSDFGGIQDTKALFAELVMYPTKGLEIQLAARHERYAHASSTDPKIGLLWKPIDRLFVRLSAGTSFEMPGFVQIFGVGPGGGSVMPIGGDIINARSSLTGNPDLSPETSTSYNVGVTWDATDNFTMNVNYWSINFKNLVAAESGDVVLAQDEADGYITDPRIILFPGSPNEVCEVTGRWDPNSGAPLPAGCLSGFDVERFNMSYVNQDFQKTSGVDFSFAYNSQSRAGQWGLTLNGTYINKYDLTTNGVLFHGVGSYNGTNFGVPAPRLRTNFAFNWNRGPHRIRATWRRISGLKDDVLANTESQDKPFNALDLAYIYTLGTKQDSRITAGVLNATDALPPARDNDASTADSALYDVRGRILRVSYTLDFQ
jgi:iron complex outermembrane receptor protein